MTEFRLPDVGEGLDQAEIVEWLVTEGEEVSRDQPLVEILTDKSQTQLPSPQAGVISKLGFAEGDMAAVGQVLVEFEGGGKAGPSPTSSTPGAFASTVGLTPRPPIATGRPKAAPVVRRRALEAGIDLTGVTGTGPGGRITLADLDSVIADSSSAKPGQPAPTQPPRGSQPTQPITSPPVGQMDIGRHPLRGIRRVTAETMAASWSIPHIHGQDELDATELLNGRRKIKELHGERARNLTPLPFFVLAVARALRRFPITNASLAGDEIVVHADVNIGIAVAADHGLIVPVVRNVDQMGIFDLADEIARLGAAARNRSVSSDDLRHGTCTISNYGSLGGRFATPIIRAPEAAIVGFGSIRERPFVVDGQVMTRPTLPISVGADHRLIDGDVMTAFQEHIIGLLAAPMALLV